MSMNVWIVLAEKMGNPSETWVYGAYTSEAKALATVQFLYAHDADSIGVEYTVVESLVS